MPDNPLPVKRAGVPRNAFGKILWAAIHQEDWDRGTAHVSGLTGISMQSVRAARKRLKTGRPVGSPALATPAGLLPTDSPAIVSKAYGVCLGTARRWLEEAGRPQGRRGRPRRVSPAPRRP